MSGARAVDGLRALARGALLLLAALLPFERIEPLAHLGPLQLSSVELFLYLALAAWGAALVAGWWAGERDLFARLRRAPRAHWAVIAFAAALFVSAALGGGGGGGGGEGSRGTAREDSCSTRRPPISCGRRRRWRARPLRWWAGRSSRPC
jgi:hypothetical protein